jgi:hypothetical protein
MPDHRAMDRVRAPPANSALISERVVG